MTESIHQAGTAPAASVGKVIGKNLQAVGHFEATLALVKYPGCPSCRTPNPKGLSFCPGCGATAPEPTDRQTVEAVVSGAKIPWFAALLLRIGNGLMRFAKWLERS